MIKVKYKLTKRKRCHGNVVYTRTALDSNCGPKAKQATASVVLLPSMSNPLEDIYFDFKHFINSALEDASLNVNKLSSLHDWVHTPTNWQVLKQLITANVLEDILSRATGVFQIIGNLLMKIGMRALLVLIAILVGVPLWLLSTSLASFFASNPITAVASCAALGVGFFVTIRALSNERDILLAFRDKVEDLWPA